MNVYDFDKTIFYPDSMLQFAYFCIRRHPKLIFTYFPKLLTSVIKNALGKEKILKVHARLNSVVAYLKDPDKDIEAYWKKHEKNISKWYLEQKRSDDLVISASPTYLLEPIIKKIGINLIGTIVDKETGVMIGNVRLAKEKAKYIIEQGMPMIENFYSDSLSDTPLALLAEHAYIVKDKARRPEPWPSIQGLYKKIHKKIDLD